MNILIINAGSSSLKYQLMDPETGVVSAKGLCERIGIDGKFTYKADGKQAIKAAVEGSNSYKFMARMTNFAKDEDIKRERERIKEANLSDKEGFLL